MATCDPKAAAAADSLVTETAVWSIPARGINEVDECAEMLESMAYSSMQLGGQELQLAIKPSTEWGSEDMSRLSSLVASRNRFVCMQVRACISVPCVGCAAWSVTGKMRRC